MPTPVPTPALPPDYRARPATEADVPAIHALLAACERELYGRAQSDQGAVAAVFARPGLRPAADTLLVHDADGRLAARAWVDRRSEVDVHPAHRGRGLGPALLDWVEARARAAGTAAVVQIVPDGDAAGGAIVRSRGYRAAVTSWLLEFAMAEEPAVSALPPGVTCRPFHSGDERQVHRLLEDAFADWQPRRKPYHEWAQHTVERPSFAAELSPLAFADSELVGAAVALDLPETGEGYLEQLAVRADHRHRGIARALLTRAFRASYRSGQRSCTLWTHSDTGALDLYLRVGMRVRHASTVYRKEF
ncbi:GNAT family N-acetyltransferase [Kitasatospora viridis]|uniref:Ribosomal protein S18 acetylase RimI-like enzyme n=1 Tax=Kitasatospora viridis TaxID=281105 RepID=A0A561UQ81_9ACTN|nr:GNAT family N-acetyltransferase [Kitasatospora viridis]TWG01522.1 ribosomal protein S18 acetylase RimI-like enzyme [Kitasatospora viridis]